MSVYINIKIFIFRSIIFWIARFDLQEETTLIDTTSYEHIKKRNFARCSSSTLTPSKGNLAMRFSNCTARLHPLDQYLLGTRLAQHLARVLSQTRGRLAIFPRGCTH